MFPSFYNIVFPACLILTGLIHLIPSRILLDPNFIKDIYGIDTVDSSIKVIILHRATFFLFLSIFSIISAFLPSLHNLAFIFCNFSMVSFVILFYFYPVETPSFQKVFKIDICLIIVITVSYIIQRYYGE